MLIRLKNSFYVIRGTQSACLIYLSSFPFHKCVILAHEPLPLNTYILSKANMNNRDDDKEESQCFSYFLRLWWHYYHVFSAKEPYSFDSQSETCRISMVEANILTPRARPRAHGVFRWRERLTSLPADFALDHLDSSFRGFLKGSQESAHLFARTHLDLCCRSPVPPH